MVLSISEGVIISSKINEFERYSTSEIYQRSNYSEKISEFDRTEAIMVASPMSITVKSDSSAPMPQTNNLNHSHQMSSAVVYKPIQSVIQSTNSSNITPITESQFNPSNSHTEYSKQDSSITNSNHYFVLRSSSDSNTINNQAPVYRERSIEETEAAHDLLSLSQSLPPLPAPCVVTILHPVTNYNVNSPDVQEITPNRSSNDYITYTSGRTTQIQSERNKKSVSTQFDRDDILPEDSSSSGMYLIIIIIFKFDFVLILHRKCESGGWIFNSIMLIDSFEFRCKCSNNTIDPTNIRIII